MLALGLDIGAVFLRGGGKPSPLPPVDPLLPGQYFTDFSEYETGVQPNDWTRRLAANFDWEVEDDAAATGGKALVAKQGAGDARNGLSWGLLDSVEGVENCLMLYRVKFPALADAEMSAMLRAQGTATSSTQTLYRHGARPGLGTNSVTTERYDAGTFGFIDRLAGYPYQSDVWYRVLVLADGNFHACSVWPEGDEKPESWMVSGTDNVKTSAGWTGLFKFRPAAAIVDFVSVGVGVDPYDPGAPPEPEALDTTGVSIDQNFDSGSYAE